MIAKLVPQKASLDAAQAGVMVEFVVVHEKEGSTATIAGGMTRCGSPEVHKAALALLDAIQIELEQMVGDEPTTPKDDSTEEDQEL